MRSGWIGFAAGLVIGAALPALAQGQQVPAQRQGPAMEQREFVAPQVETPDFYNLTLQQVNQANQTTVGARDGTIPIFNQVIPSGPRDGVVASQIPEAGTKVFPGRQALTVTMRPAPTKKPPMTKVPPLSGMSVADARLALQKSSLQLGQISGQTKSRVALSIVSQTPVAGTRVAVNTTVDVTLQQPPRTYVPDVTGLMVDGAVAKLQQFQLQLGQVTSQTSNWAGLKIVSQNPQAGASVSLETAVGVTLELPRVPVPNLKGRTVAEARTALNGVGLQLGPVKGEVESPVTQTISSQTPEPKTSVVVGTQVEVTLEPPQVKVPDLTGSTVAQARNTCTVSGWNWTRYLARGTAQSRRRL